MQVQAPVFPLVAVGRLHRLALAEQQRGRDLALFCHEDVVGAAGGLDVHDLDADQRRQWVAAAQPLSKQFGDDAVGTEVMNRLKEINAKYK